LLGSAKRAHINETKVISQFLDAYSDNPAEGCPFDGKNTTYGQASQFKRMSAIFTDTVYTEAWTEYLEEFSKHTQTWGVLWGEPIPGPGISEAYGVQHASDLPYYFPTLLGKTNDPRNNKESLLMQQLQNALINFVVGLDPNGTSCDKGGLAPKRNQWPKYGRQKAITCLTAFSGVHAVPLPYREGFEVMRKTFRRIKF
jgi:acetylcholinesterase